MTQAPKETAKESSVAKERTNVRYGSPPGAIYGIGVLGGWVWFWQQSDGFWGHAWAIVEGILWPAYLVYQAFAALD